MKNGNPILWIVVAAAALGVTAGGHGQGVPPNCSAATGTVIGTETISPVVEGQEIVYQVGAAVSDFSGCHAYGGQLVCILPDGTEIKVAGFGDETPDYPEIPTVTYFQPFIVSVPAPYIVDPGDAETPGEPGDLLRATVRWTNGIILTPTPSTQTSENQASLALGVPGMGVTPAPVGTVCGGQETEIEFEWNVANTGNVSIMNLATQDSTCSPVYVSGDDNGNGMLDPEEFFLDLNGNDIRDAGEPFYDADGNGEWGSVETWVYSGEASFSQAGESVFTVTGVESILESLTAQAGAVSTVTAQPSPLASINPASAELCEVQSLQLCAQTGSEAPPYDFAWFGPDGFEASGPCIMAGSEGEYCVTVTDGHGCSTTVCSVLECPAGACCLGDGGCADDQTQADCLAIGGSWQGKNSSCADAPCPSGACCLTDGTCTTAQTMSECISLGGGWAGTGTDCGTFGCPGSACCLDDGTCADTQTLDLCVTIGGNWAGVGSACAGTTCPGGACCHDDGGCDDLATEGDCAASGGTWLGAGTECGTDDCPDGACCLGDGTCAIVFTAAECETSGGSWQGAGSSCEKSACPGACCLPDGDCLDGQSLGACSALAGIYQGLGASCATSQCPGACCLPDGDCVVSGASDCAGQGGAYQGFGTDCSVVCEPQVSCCLPDGTCAPVVMKMECSVMGGTPQFGACSDSSCPAVCCLLDGSCTSASVIQCEELAGEYRGFGTTCALFVCPPACCLLDGTCRVAGPDECDIQGNLPDDPTTCDLLICNGACCLPDGGCVVTTLNDCDSQGGDYQGYEVECGEVVCPVLCVGDVDDNGVVDLDDLVIVVLAWGTDDPVADLNRSGLVDVDDVVLVITAFGVCP